MKKLLLLSIVLFNAIVALSQTNPLTVSFRGNTPVNSKDTIAYNYPGKIGGYSWLYNAEYIRTNFASLSNTPYVIPDQFAGATDYLRVLAAIASGKTVWFNRMYDIGNHTLNMTDGQAFISDRNGGIKHSGAIAVRPGNGSSVIGLKFTGSRSISPNLAEIAIKISGKSNVLIDHNIGDDIGGYFVLADSTVAAGPVFKLNQVKNNYVSNSHSLFKSGVRGEYVALLDNQGTGLDTAVIRLGGNVELRGGIYNQNTVGLYDGDDGINGNHAICVGATFNHNVQNLVIEGLTNGLGNQYVGNSFQAGKIIIRNSKNVIITGGLLNFGAADSLINDSSTIKISHATIVENPHYTEINGGTHDFKNNRLYLSGGATDVQRAFYESAGVLASADFLGQGNGITGVLHPATSTSTNPFWDKVNLPSEVTGLLPDANISSAATWNAKASNPMTTLGDLTYGGASGIPTRLAGETSTTRKFLSSVGVGGIATAPTLFDLFNTSNTWDVVQTYTFGIRTAYNSGISFTNSGSFINLQATTPAGANTVLIPDLSGTVALTNATTLSNLTTVAGGTFGTGAFATISNYIPFIGGSNIGNLGLGGTALSGGGLANWGTFNGTGSYSGGTIYSIGGVAKGYGYVDATGMLFQGDTGVPIRFMPNGVTALTLNTSGVAVFANPFALPSGSTASTPSGSTDVANKAYVDAVAGVRLTSFYTDQAATTTPTDVYSYTLAANSLTTNGQYVQGEYQSVFTGGVSTGSDVIISFGGTTVYDTGAYLGTGTNPIGFKLIRTGTTTARCLISYLATSGLITYTKADLTGLDFTTTNVIKANIVTSAGNTLTMQGASLLIYR